MKHFGNEVNSLLKKKGLTRKDLANKLGMTEANIYKILKKESIDTKLLDRVSEILDVPISFWFDESYSIGTGNHIAIGDNSNIIQGKNKGTVNYSGKVTQTNQGQSRNDCSEQELEIKYLKQKVKDQELLIEEKDCMIEEKERMIEEKERMIQLLLGNKGK
ncbi:MAG: helix-turn-helix transcriptional regulator [Bacteroidales bacterium]|nr:helix-turn-helix transcriptional regulator [Bacteroidales bacterium]